MIVIPDLFGSFQKGREAAIEANWKDLQNYESIENARHQNDASALSNLATMADFGVRRRMVQNEGTNSDLNTQLNVAQMPAKLNIAEGDAMYTGIQLGTMKANEDAIRRAAANQLGTYVLGADTGYKNAYVGNGKATIGQEVFDLTYPALFNAVYQKAGADIDMTRAYSQFMPTITRNNYRGQVYSSAGAADAAGVDYRYAIPIATAKNIAGLKGHQASAAGSDLSYLTTTGEIAKLPYTFTGNANSDILKLQELQKGLDPNSGEYKTLQGAIDTIRNGNEAVMRALGYDGISTSYFAPTPPSATSQGTGSTTYVDPSTGRAITVPYATTGVGPLASGYVPYGSNGINLFTGSSQPRTLNEITANLTTPQQNVMGVQNIGGVPNIPTAQRTSTAVHFLPNGQRVVTTAPVSPPTQLPSQNQLIKNLNNRRGGFL